MILLRDEKVTSVRKICREFEVKPEGSIMDMSICLGQKSISKSAFDNIYEKVFGCSDGWAVGACGHGIVYAVKNLLRAESPRDYFDMERSFRYRPNVTICDMAHLLARHANRNISEFYHPNSGRLSDSTEENIQNAESGCIKFSAPFIVNNAKDHKEGSHPVTGSNVHLSLYDWFHEGNCKKREEVLRKSSLLVEISSIVDTQAVEQLFSSMKRNLYFLNNLKPCNHLFIFRLLCHLRNKQKNSNILAYHKKTFGAFLSYNQYGQIKQMRHDKHETADARGTEIVFEEVPELEEDVYQTNKGNGGQRITVENEAQDDLHVNEANGNQIQQDDLDVNEANGNQIQQDDLHVNVIESRYQRLKLLEYTITKVISDSDSVSEQEMSAISSNARYANTVLFKTADNSRTCQVRFVKSPFGPFQTQGTTNFCGICAVNNALGMSSSVPIDISTVDEIADNLWLQMVHDPAHGIKLLVEPMRDREGFYSVQVLQSAFSTKGFEMIQLNSNSLFGINSEDIGQSVKTQLLSAFGICTLILRLLHHHHWLTIKVVDDVIILMDSTANAPSVISSREMGNMISSNLGCVYFICPTASSKAIVTGGGNTSADEQEQQRINNEILPLCNDEKMTTGNAASVEYNSETTNNEDPSADMEIMTADKTKKIYNLRKNRNLKVKHEW